MCPCRNIWSAAPTASRRCGAGEELPGLQRTGRTLHHAQRLFRRQARRGACLGARELLDGTRIEAPAGGTRLSCVGGDVRVTSGAVLVVYRLAEYDFVPVIAGAVLIVFARFLRPARRRPSQRPRGDVP